MADRNLTVETIQQLVPVDLDKLAADSGVIRRQRKIRSGALLLHTLLTHAEASLRVAAAATSTRVGEFLGGFSDQAVHDLAARSVPFLADVLQSLLPAAGGQAACDRIGRPVHFIDGTHVCAKFADRAIYRIHAVADGRGRALNFDITRDDSAGTERLDRATFPVGSLVSGDRGLSKATGIRALHERGVYSLTRLHSQNLRLARRGDGDGSGAAVPRCDTKGSAIRWQPESVLAAIHKRGLEPGQACEMPVFVLVGSRAADAVPARLVAVRISDDAERAELASLRSKAKRGGRQLKATTIGFARYLVMVTTLPDGELDPIELGVIYRARWQIEEMFRQFKSDFGLAEVTKKKDVTIRAFLLSKLILAVLAGHFADTVFPPRDHECTAA